MGYEADEAVKIGNAVARITIKRMLQVMARGGAILVENPLLSFFWWLPEVLTIIGMPGMVLVRMDDCMFGEPYRKARLWLTNIENLTCGGEVCNHDLPHPEALDGGKRNRQTATYPYGVVATIVEIIAANWDGSKPLGSDNSQIAADALLNESDELDDVKELYQKTGRKNVEMTRSGQTEYAEGCTKKDMTAIMGPVLSKSKGAVPSGTTDEIEEEPAEAKAGEVPLVRHARKGREVANNPADYERKNILYMQRSDPDFKDIVEILEWSPSPEGPQTEEVLDEARFQFKDALAKTGVAHSEANKRADAAKKEMKMYELDDVLYRLVQQTDGFERRVVVPAGDVKSFTNLGRRFKLSYRRRLLLHYHDGEMEGTHPGVEETVAKIAQTFWWPTLKKDVVKWVRTCAVCTLVKPQPCLTASERS